MVRETGAGAARRPQPRVSGVRGGPHHAVAALCTEGERGAEGEDGSREEAGEGEGKLHGSCLEAAWCMAGAAWQLLGVLNGLGLPGTLSSPTQERKVELEGVLRSRGVNVERLLQDAADFISANNVSRGCKRLDIEQFKCVPAAAVASAVFQILNMLLCCHHCCVPAHGFLCFLAESFSGRVCRVRRGVP